jgi:hypothetical protein
MFRRGPHDLIPTAENTSTPIPTGMLLWPLDSKSRVQIQNNPYKPPPTRSTSNRSDFTARTGTLSSNLCPPSTDRRRSSLLPPGSRAWWRECQPRRRRRRRKPIQGTNTQNPNSLGSTLLQDPGEYNAGFPYQRWTTVEANRGARQIGAKSRFRRAIRAASLSVSPWNAREQH